MLSAPSRPRLSPTRALTTGAGVAVAGAYAGWVAQTKPFTTQADVAVAVGFVLMVTVVARTLRHRRAGTPAPARPARPRRRYLPWAIAIGALLALELAAYGIGFSASRHAFPTLSSLYDEVSRSPADKAGVVFVWMMLGWGLFRR